MIYHSKNCIDSACRNIWCCVVHVLDVLLSLCFSGLGRTLITHPGQIQLQLQLSPQSVFCTRSLPLFHAFACRFTYKLLTILIYFHPILYNFYAASSQLKQVHEKGVLFPSLAVCLLPSAVPKTWKPLTWILALHFQGMSLFSM